MTTTPTHDITSALATLLDVYRDLDSRVIQTRAITYREKVSGGRALDSEPPLNVGTIDSMGTIERFASDAYRTCHEALNVDTPKQDRRVSLRTQRQIVWIANALPTVRERSEAAIDTIEAGLWWTLEHAPMTRAAAPFRLSTPCPRCRLQSLWADPQSAQVACGMPECDARWTTGEFVSELASI